MKSSVEEVVDRALDRYIAAMRQRGNGASPDGVKCRTLAGFAKVPSSRMSAWLQNYRWIQSQRLTRYVIGCNSYGVNARWRILARPGTDPIACQLARAEQAKWVTEDMAARHARDIVREIEPGLKGKALDAKISEALPFITHVLVGVVEHINRIVSSDA